MRCKSDEFTKHHDQMITNVIVKCSKGDITQTDKKIFKLHYRLVKKIYKNQIKLSHCYHTAVVDSDIKLFMTFNFCYATI